MAMSGDGAQLRVCTKFDKRPALMARLFSRRQVRFSGMRPDNASARRLQILSLPIPKEEQPEIVNALLIDFFVDRSAA
jgi:hypothetical protein